MVFPGEESWLETFFVLLACAHMRNLNVEPVFKSGATSTYRSILITMDVYSPGVSGPGNLEKLFLSTGG